MCPGSSLCRGNCSWLHGQIRTSKKKNVLSKILHTDSDYLRCSFQDCNGDGVINCDDFAHIHVLGGFGCNAPINQTPFYKGYLECRSKVQSLSG